MRSDRSAPRSRPRRRTGAGAPRSRRWRAGSNPSSPPRNRALPSLGLENVAVAPGTERIDLGLRSARRASVAELISTQKRHPFNCDTRTVTSERRTGSRGLRRRSSTPYRIATAMNSFGTRPHSRPASAPDRTSLLIPEKRSQVPGVTLDRLGGNSHGVARNKSQTAPVYDRRGDLLVRFATTSAGVEYVLLV